MHLIRHTADREQCTSAERRIDAKKSKIDETCSALYIDIPESVLTDLDRRLSNTRWPSQVDGSSRDAGTAPDYLRELIEYWKSDYDWRKEEAALNQLSHFKTEIDGQGIHFIHVRGKGPRPFPILLTHGYPDSFYHFAKIIPMRTDPASFGAAAEDAFDVVVPAQASVRHPPAFRT